MLNDLRQDLHYALRTIRHSPGYAITAILCLALGIGVNAVVFSVVDGLFFRRLPLPGAERLVTVDRNGELPCSWQDFTQFRRLLHSFSGLAAFLPKGTFIDIGRINKGIFTELVFDDYARVMGLRPALGRWFNAADAQPGAAGAAVVSDRLWDRYFHRDPLILGKTFRMENGWYRIIGVAPRGFRGISAPLTIDVWAPLPTYPIYGAMAEGPDGGPGVLLIGRLADGIGPAAAAAEMNAIDARLHARGARARGGSLRRWPDCCWAS